MTLHLGVERLSKLLVSGNAWSGHISAGVYIPHTKGDPAVSDLLDGVAKFHQSVEQAGKFHLDIGIVYGLQPDLGQTAAELYRKQYPVNTLRNVALAQVSSLDSMSQRNSNVLAICHLVYYDLGEESCFRLVSCARSIL